MPSDKGYLLDWEEEVERERLQPAPPPTYVFHVEDDRSKWDETYDVPGDPFAFAQSLMDRFNRHIAVTSGRQLARRCTGFELKR